MGPDPHLNPTRRCHFNLVQSTVFCFQPLKKISNSWKTPKCWLIKIHEKPGKFHFTDPLSRFHYQNLSPPLPERLNPLDFRVSEVTKTYDLRFVGNCEMPVLGSPEFSSFRSRTVAVCSEGADFAVMAVHTHGKLSIWRNNDEKWVGVTDGRDDAVYHDVVCHNGKFYAVDGCGLTISVDLSLTIAIVTPAKPPVDLRLTQRLLSSLDGLFLIDWDFDPSETYLSGGEVVTSFFHVYKLGDDNRKWAPVRDLGNRAIFVGDDCSFSVSAQEYRGCMRNCIYYNGGCFWPGEDHPGRDAVLFDLEDQSSTFLSEVFGYSGLFWPSPSWVMPCADVNKQL